MFKKFKSIFGTTNEPKYTPVKTNEKFPMVLAKKNVIKNKSKEYYVNMLYIYFFNDDDYNELRKKYSYLPTIKHGITVGTNFDNNLHKEIKQISYVRYSQKNGLQKTVKFNNDKKLKNDSIKKLKSLYTQKFDLSTKYANYEILQRDIINCLKQLQESYDFLNTAIYFITKEKLKKTNSSFKLPSFFSKDVANFSKNENGIINMSGIISLKKLKNNINTKIQSDIVSSKNNLNKITESDINKKQFITQINYLIYYLINNTTRNLHNTLLFYNYKTLNPIKRFEINRSINKYLEQKQISDEIKDIIEKLINIFKIYNLIKSIKIKYIIQDKITNIIQSIDLIDKNKINEKIISDINLISSLLKDYDKRFVINNNKNQQQEIIDKLLFERKNIKLLEKLEEKKYLKENIKENNIISTEIYKSKIEHEKIIYIYFLEKKDLQNYNNLECNSTCLKNIEGKSFFKYSNKNGFEITPFFRSKIEKLNNDIIPYLIKSIKEIPITLNGIKMNLNESINNKLTNNEKKKKIKNQIKFFKNKKFNYIKKIKNLFLNKYNNKIIKLIESILLDFTAKNYHSSVESRIKLLEDKSESMYDSLMNDINQLTQYKFNFNLSQKNIESNIHEILNKINDFFYNINVSILINDNKIKIIELNVRNQVKKSKNIIILRYERILKQINNLLNIENDNKLKEYKTYIETIRERQYNNLQNTFLNKMYEIEKYVEDISPEILKMESNHITRQIKKLIKHYKNEISNTSSLNTMDLSNNSSIKNEKCTILFYTSEQLSKLRNFFTLNKNDIIDSTVYNVLINLNSNIKYLSDKYNIFITKIFEEIINNLIDNLKKISSSNNINDKKIKSIKNRLNINYVKNNKTDNSSVRNLKYYQKITEFNRTISQLKIMKKYFKSPNFKRSKNELNIELNKLKLKLLSPQSKKELEKKIKQKKRLEEEKKELNEFKKHESQIQLNRLHDKMNDYKYHIYDSILNTEDNLLKLKLINKIYRDITVCVVIKDNKIMEIIILEPNTKTSESNTKTSESNIKTSESNIKTSESNIKPSESNIKPSINDPGFGMAYVNLNINKK